MKTYRSLWNNFIDEENVFESIQAALRGKSKNLYVDVVKNDIGWYAEHIYVQARILEWVAMPSSRESSNPGLPHCRIL